MTTETTNTHRPVIVVGYDGSPTARAAVDHAARQAGGNGKLYLVHAYAPAADWLGFPNYQRVLDDHLARGQATIDALTLTDEPLQGTDYETELLDSPPAEAIMVIPTPVAEE